MATGGRWQQTRRREERLLCRILDNDIRDDMYRVKDERRTRYTLSRHQRNQTVTRNGPIQTDTYQRMKGVSTVSNPTSVSSVSSSISDHQRMHADRAPHPQVSYLLHPKVLHLSYAHHFTHPITTFLLQNSETRLAPNTAIMYADVFRRVTN